MFTFRQKIFITYIIVILMFIALMFPFASSTVQKIATKAMSDRANELIVKIQSAPNNDALIRRLKEQKPLIFFRVSVITDERKVLYDSHTKRLLGPRFSQEYVVDHPEVQEAFDTGTGYHEDYSELLGQKFSYFAKAFDFHGKKYVMRTAFPHKYVTELTHDFELGMIAVATIILLLFSAMTWFIINHLTKPIGLITEAIRPYQEGLEPHLPEIVIKAKPADEFRKLAETLNSLSARIRRQINTLTGERNERVAILESLVEGVVAIDHSGVITYANQSALKLLNCENTSIIGATLASLNQPKCTTLVQTCQEKKEPLQDTLEIKKEGTTPIYLDLIASPKKDNTGAILVLQDKTAHYRVLEMRKDFVANASHELKTPITIIRGFAETLHDHPDLPTETLQGITDKIVRNCTRMASLIKDLLTLSDIENIPTSRLSSCNLAKLLDHCRETVMNLHPTAQIEVHNQTKDAVITADASLIELAFMNLIENAAKYSVAPAHITVTLEEINGDLSIAVADRGIGIPPADLEHIFEKFYTVDKAHSRKMGGSGLGLSIVKTIIDKHFGKITLTSTLGQGTTFTVRLPRKRT